MMMVCHVADEFNTFQLTTDTGKLLYFSTPYLKGGGTLVDQNEDIYLHFRKGCNLNDKNKEFLTPLHVATDKSHYDVMELLLKHGAKVRSQLATLHIHCSHVGPHVTINPKLKS